MVVGIGEGLDDFEDEIGGLMVVADGVVNVFFGWDDEAGDDTERVDSGAIYAVV